MDVPAVRNAARLTGGSGVDGEALDQDGEPSERELASPEVREVDTVEALKIGLYRVGVLEEERDERRQFPAIPRAFWISRTNSFTAPTFGFVALKAAC